MSAINLIYLIGMVAAGALVWAIILELRLRRLLRGKSGGDLEDVIKKISHDLDNLIAAKIELKKDLEALREGSRHYIRAVKTVRFNPFKDSGSNQSFATAFLCDKGDGVVISSLYSRDRVGIYAKPLREHKSEYELTDEEKKAIAESRSHIV